MTHPAPRLIGTKHLPDGTVLRLQLVSDGIEVRRRVQQRVLPGLWLRLPEWLALREALVWNWHERPTIDAEGHVQVRSVFMALPRGVELLPLNDEAAERWIVGLYAQVANNTWYDEATHAWRQVPEFFAERK